MAHMNAKRMAVSLMCILFIASSCAPVQHHTGQRPTSEARKKGALERLESPSTDALEKTTDRATQTVAVGEHAYTDGNEINDREAGDRAWT